MFIQDRMDQELHSRERSEFFDKIPVEILLDVFFRVLGFLKSLFMP